MVRNWRWSSTMMEPAALTPDGEHGVMSSELPGPAKQGAVGRDRRRRSRAPGLEEV